MVSSVRGPRWLTIVRGVGTLVLIASVGLTVCLVDTPGVSQGECVDAQAPRVAATERGSSKVSSAAECGRRWTECTNEMKACRERLARCHEKIGELQPSHEAFLAGEPEPEWKRSSRNARS